MSLRLRAGYTLVVKKVTVKYVSVDKTSLRKDPDGTSALETELIWGDRVDILGEQGAWYQGTARRKTGWVKKADLGDQSLLEVYVNDVGQGDSVLIKTPDGKWHLIDAGKACEEQMTKKGAANFLRWKFIDDLKEPSMALENVIVSHPDDDHYGGMLNVLTGDPGDGGTFVVSVASFWHSGFAKFKSAPKLGATEDGTSDPLPIAIPGVESRGTFVTELLDGRDSFGNPSRPFETKFQKYAALVSTVPGSVRRLTNHTQYLPGYGPGENPVTIRVLGPVLESLQSGSVGFRKFNDSDSETVNGHSVVLLITYGNARILLSGDLNAAAQRLLMSMYPAGELAADVLKGCHHGSDDVDMQFLAAVGARATVISSGDNESYSHPRPMLVGACGRYGRRSKTRKGTIQTPLIYSTEIARSVALGFAKEARFRQQAADPFTDIKPSNVSVKAENWTEFRSLDKKAPVSTKLVYGLVNVRTDGAQILCGTLKESGNTFDLRTFLAGADVPDDA
jgi:beta-lactamase superfamily II metal-dependent hydrolase